MSKDNPMSLAIALDFATNPRPLPSRQGPADTMDELREALCILAETIHRCRDLLADVPGETLEDRVSKLVGYYLELQLFKRCGD
jgi:hypothetical protein